MEEIIFESRELFRRRMKISLPNHFTDMPDYLAKKKYPSKYRPPLIMMDEDTTVNYLFNLLETCLPKTEIGKATDGLYKNLKRVYPNGRFDKVNFIDRQNGIVAWFSYETKVTDDELFQIAYVTDIDGKVMNGAFNCQLGNKDFWFDKVLYSIRSIEDLGGGNGK